MMPGSIDHPSVQMSDSQILERTQRFLSLLRHCQVLGLSVEHADRSGLTLMSVDLGRVSVHFVAFDRVVENDNELADRIGQLVEASGISLT